MYKEDYKLIQDFFEFELTEKEVQDFEYRMEVDRYFFQKVQAYDFVNEKIAKDFTGVSFEEKRPLQEKWLAELERENNKRAPLKPARIWWAMAATIGVLVIAIAWLGQSENNEITYKQLALNKWEDTQENFTQRSSIHIANHVVFANAIKSYQLQKYEDCLSQLMHVDSTFSFYEQALLLNGQAHFRLEELDQAIVNFEEIIEFKDSELRDIAYWNQALVHIYMENIGEAKQVLNLIIEDNYPLAKKAQELLNQLQHR